jgi:hypothetical protein
LTKIVAGKALPAVLEGVDSARNGDQSARVVRVRRFAIWAALLCPALAFAWVVQRDNLQLGSALRAVAQKPHPGTSVDARSLPRAAPRALDWLGNVQSTRVSELSGLAVSNVRDDLLFAINDSGDDAVLYALGVHGEDRGSLRVRGARNLDWEDLAAFELDGVAYLLIADTGDNLAWRPAITLYVVREPHLTGERYADGASVTPDWILRARFPDGPTDCEAVAVDTAARQILLLSKRTAPPVLYALPLAPRHDDPNAREAALVAKKLVDVSGIPRPFGYDAEHDPYSECPTALDLARDGSQAFVLTYRRGYLFPRAPGESWAAAFARLPQRVRVPHLPAQEAAAFARDGQSIYVSSEGRHAALVRLGPAPPQ